MWPNSLWRAHVIDRISKANGFWDVKSESIIIIDTESLNVQSADIKVSSNLITSTWLPPRPAEHGGEPLLPRP